MLLAALWECTSSPVIALVLIQFKQDTICTYSMLFGSFTCIHPIASMHYRTTNIQHLVYRQSIRRSVYCVSTASVCSYISAPRYQINTAPLGILL